MILNRVRFIAGNEDFLDIIEPLWEELNKHHQKLSPYFKEEYQTMNFARRKATLLVKAAEGKLRIDIAEDSDEKKAVGYCISSVDKDGQGEIDSLFIKTAYRGGGVGDVLVRRALAWFDEHQISNQSIHVAVGNETAFGFYARYGFLPRQTILKLKR